MLNQKDPQLIVIDEMVGFLCGEFLFSFGLTALLWSFALFFDLISYLPKAE
jgi:phosphatidylglycerophosphatase A